MAKIDSTLLNKIYTGLCIISKDYIVLLWNQFIAQSTGIAQEEIIGRKIDELFPRFKEQSIRLRLEMVFQGGAPIVLSSTLNKGLFSDISSSTERYFEIIVTPFESDEVSQTVLLTINDVTELNRQISKYRNMRDKAISNAETKSRFLANMSHEIRTPLNAIVGFIDLAMKDSALSESVISYLSIVKKSSNNLLTIINDILHVSKYESGKLKVDNVALNLDDLIKTVFSSLEASASKKDLKLISKIEPPVSSWINSDKQKLYQILLNLLGNSIKFTDKGNISLCVSLREKDILLFSVTDTGIGMTQKEIDRIFEPFSQADESTSRKYGGTGLGTTICKQMVELLGGEIWVKSKKGEGTSFHFTLPYIQAALHEDREVTKRPVIDRHPLKLNILLAEDIEENRMLINLHLSRKGHNVTLTNNGAEALEQYSNNHFDIILMDIHMPVMDGIQTTAKIRNLEAGTDNHIPIIALTASVMKHEQEKFLHSGFDSIVAKPIDFGLLVQAINDLSGFSEGHSIDKESIEYPEIDFEKGLHIWTDENIYRKALKKFAQNYNDIPSELDDLITQGEFKEVLKKVHGVKGVSANLALLAIEEECKRIEQSLSGEDSKDFKATISHLERILFRTISTIQKL